MAGRAREGGDGLAASVLSATTRPARQAIYNESRSCAICGAHYHGSGVCPACHGRGRVQWGSRVYPPHRFRLQVVRDAEAGTKSSAANSYLWAAMRFPELAENPVVMEGVRRELGAQPSRALLGEAPDFLGDRGLDHAVQAAASQLPGLAEVSLRASLSKEV